MVDWLAAEKMRCHSGTRPSQPPAWMPQVNDKIITGNIGTTIKREIYRPIITQRWIGTLGIPNDLSTQCDWDAYYRSIATRRPSLKIQFTKYNARILPVGTNLVRRKHSTSDKCPCCGLVEDHDHLLRCTHPEMTKEYESLVKDVDCWLQDTTSGTVHGAIMQLLRVYRLSSDDDLVTEHHNRYVQQQLLLGSRAFFAGVWRQYWKTSQTEYLNIIRSQRSASLWLNTLLHKIQEIPIHMWNTRNTIMHNSIDAPILRASMNQ
jgi:hypothetical protein